MLSGSGDSVPQEAVTKEVPVKRPQPRTKPPRQARLTQEVLTLRSDRILVAGQQQKHIFESKMAPSQEHQDAVLPCHCARNLLSLAGAQDPRRLSTAGCSQKLTCISSAKETI